MVALSDNWLDHLVKHPIFQLEEKDTQRVEYNKMKHNTTNNDVTGFILQHHTRVMTMRDNDLFVAVGSHIRVLNLVEFKDAWIAATKKAIESNAELSSNWFSSVPFKLLDTPEINFTIVSLAANTNGRLLSVTGESSLVIVCLPRHSFSAISLTKQKVDCRTLTVGRKYYKKNQAEILKVEWHPLSETHTHIVALSSDNILRIFDASTDIDEPEQTFDLSPVKKSPSRSVTPGRGFTFEDDDVNGYEDAVTFSLGGKSHKQSGWEPFSIFYALRSGHMYALCPVIPFRSIIHKKHLDNLTSLTEAKYQKAKSDDSKDHQLMSLLFKLQKQWLQHLSDSSKVGRKTNLLNSDMISVVSNDMSIKFDVKRQGPFLVNQENTVSTSAQVTDILYIYDEPVSILALALSNSQVKNHVLLSEIDPQWQIPTTNTKEDWHKELGTLLTDRDFLPKAMLYETFDLKTKSLPPTDSLRLLNDPIYPDTYYIYHTGGVTAIGMSKWLEAYKNMLKKIEDEQDYTLTALKRLLSEKTQSDVRYLINTAPFSNAFTPIVGLFVIVDLYLSYTLVAVTDEYKLVYRDLNMRSDPEQDKAYLAATKNQLKHIASTDNSPAYEPLLPLPIFEKPKQLDNLPTQSKIAIPKNLADSKEIVINEETLRFFSKSAEQVRRETRDIRKAAAKIEERIALQQKEFEKQVETVRELNSRLEKYCSPQSKKAQKQAIEEISQRHQRLRLRMDEQLRQIINYCQPGLSIEENKWIEKLQELSDKVSGASGYASRIELVKKSKRKIE
ncbi:hypothetical protein RMCBS344292_09182 [Rhizopus microsporus]|nr:hypothetical protein RMCBS344292_09182 [Rhizopus microsporus]